ncbi:hypothetical protein ANO11243_077620 [Dothideomycetidae sp. 11243]|nr:hypothetical protein ANO11243_077620 [fungal sp. No.11243]
MPPRPNEENFAVLLLHPDAYRAAIIAPVAVPCPPVDSYLLLLFTHRFLARHCPFGLHDSTHRPNWPVAYRHKAALSIYIWINPRLPSPTSSNLAFTMDCFPDFCLGCDKTAIDGFYCSESCRLADIERSSSTPSSPTHTTANALYAVLFAPTFNQPPSRYPPPPTKTVSLTDLQSMDAASQSRIQHKRPFVNRSTHSTPPRVLSPSSSRSSLISTPTTEVMSEDAAKELISYFNAFDRTREQRRRSLPGKSLPWPAERSGRGGH